MLKFYGKPHELRAFLKELGEQYGKNQKAIAIYIMIGKEMIE
jgi:hypothetical protein